MAQFSLFFHFWIYFTVSRSRCRLVLFFKAVTYRKASQSYQFRRKKKKTNRLSSIWNESQRNCDHLYTHIKKCWESVSDQLKHLFTLNACSVVYFVLRSGNWVEKWFYCFLWLFHNVFPNRFTALIKNWTGQCFIVSMVMYMCVRVGDSWLNSKMQIPMS